MGLFQDGFLVAKSASKRTLEPYENKVNTSNENATQWWLQTQIPLMSYQ